MSSGRAKNFRRRSEDSGVNGDEKPSPTPPNTTATTTTITSSSSSFTADRSQTLGSAAKPKSSKPSGPKRLSFADDDEDEDSGGGGGGGRGVALRRSPARAPSSAAAVHKLTAAKDRLKSSGPLPPILSNVQPQAGEYTKERLRELQKNARPLGGMPKPQPTTAPSFSEPKSQKPEPASSGPVIVLKGLLKPMSVAATAGGTQRGVSKDEEEEEEEEEEERGDGDEERADGERQRKLPVIPDRATIDAIRAKRQQMQQPRRPGPDYISVDGGGMLSSRPSGGVSSDEEDNDFQGRIALFGDKVGGKTKKGVFESIEEPVSISSKFQEVGINHEEDEDDEEERKWEEEQFRKGLGRRLDETSSHRGASSVSTVVPVQPQPSIYSGIAPSTGNVQMGASVLVTRSAEVMSITQQAEVATRALQDNIGKLKESHKITLNSLVRTDTQLSEALSEMSDLEKSLEAADKKYAFMQQLREFISVICDFLNDKAFYIEELEEQMQKVHETRALAISDRRAFDLAEEGIEIEAAVSAAMSVLSKGSGPAYVSAAAAAAQKAMAAPRECPNLPVELDEFGRDVNLRKRMDFGRRAKERKMKRAESESKRMSSLGKDNKPEQIEGEVSTDESETEICGYGFSRSDLLSTADEIFADASEEYSSLRVVKERLEDWKNKYSSTYRDAYVSLSVPAVFSPYVRLELLKWDPLYRTTDFFDMEWHKLLFDYGKPGGDHDFEPDDADVNLIPGLVEKIALPILHHEIAHCWDIFSTRMTENAVFATNMVISYVPGSSKALHELLAVVPNRLNEAISRLSVPAWNTMVTKVVPGAAQFAAYRFGMSIRLLRSICLWQNILALPILEKLALEELLGGKLLPHLRSIMSDIHDAITRTERIVASLSGVWAGPEVKSGPSQKLWPLVDFVAELGSKLERRHVSGASEEETRGLARRLKNILVSLNEYDRARTILKTFQLKEAL